MFRNTLSLFKHHFQFDNLKLLMAKASPIRSGDQLAGIAAISLSENVAAQSVLSMLPLETFIQEWLIPPEQDEVTRLIIKQHDTNKFLPIAKMTIGELRDFLLSNACDEKQLNELQYALTPEMVAAVSKIMRNQDLISVAKKCRIVTAFRNTIGLPGRFATRLQPNDPTDNIDGIKSGIVDGLLYGCGDAVIGVNPATDNLNKIKNMLVALDNIRQQLNAPIQSCVLTHISNSILLAKEGVPIDLFFQSIGGSEAVNKSFGISLDMLREAYELGLSLKRGTISNNFMYFETGQGSALSANGHHGVDQQTIETRSYAVAREYSPLLVNTVVGFIGPEYLYDGKQITRAALEDHFCGKLLGLPMGVDVCYTNHAHADQNDMDNLLLLLAEAGCHFVMAVPGADDVMLNYQSTSFHDSRYIRNVTGLRPSPEFETWLENLNITNKNQLCQFYQPTPFNRLLPSATIKTLTDTEIDPSSSLEQALQICKHQQSDREYNLSQFSIARVGMGHTGGQLKTNDWLKFNYAHAQAKDAVYGELNIAMLVQYCKQNQLRYQGLSSQANDPEQFLLRPDLGQLLSSHSQHLLSNHMFSQQDILIVISGGLSPNAINKNAIPFLETFLKLAQESDWSIASLMLVPRSRVALGDHINAYVNAKMVVMLIGERPGMTSPHSMGIYFTYDAKPGHTHDKRNCISNIHQQGLLPEKAAHHLHYLIQKAFQLGLTGVNLKDDYSAEQIESPPQLSLKMS